MVTTRHQGNLATTTAPGTVELATSAEIDIGTDTERVPSVDALMESKAGQKTLEFHIVDSGTSVTTGNGAEGRVIPDTLHGMDLVAAIAAVTTKGVTDTTDVMVRRSRAGSDADMLSTAITIGDQYYASDGVIDTANDDVLLGDVIFIDVDDIHSGTAPLGLYVTLTFRLP